MSGYPPPGEPPLRTAPLLSTTAPKRVPARALIGSSALLAIIAGVLVVGGPAYADEPDPADGTAAVAPVDPATPAADPAASTPPPVADPPPAPAAEPPVEPAGPPAPPVDPAAAIGEPPSGDAPPITDTDSAETTDRGETAGIPLLATAPPLSLFTSNPYATDLEIQKTHDELPEEPIDGLPGDLIPYRVVVTNVGPGIALDVVVTDQLPEGLTVDQGSVVAPTGWTVTFPTEDSLQLEAPGSMAVGEQVEVTFDAVIGELPRDGIGSLIDDIVNVACVEAYQVGRKCDDDEIPVKSIALQAEPVCLANVPVVSFTITPNNIVDPPAVAMIWWTAEAYALRDPSVPSGDEAGILADGASKVEYVTVPADWVSGDPITGQRLWPGAAVDALGNPTDWPGWTQLGDGTWVLDPLAPFYDLRLTSVIEFRINPSVSTAVSYPPAEEGCEPENPHVDLTVEKTHGQLSGDAVDSADGDRIDYTITIRNNGSSPATGVSFVDTLPAGLVADGASIVGPTGWTYTVTPTGLEGSTPDPLAPGGEVVITFSAVVGELPRAAIELPLGDITNNVCVDSTEPDMNPDDNCGTDTVRTRSISLSAAAVCQNDTPYVGYSITPVNVLTVPPPAVALIWWTPEGYAGRDPDIDASEEALILADGALQVDYVTVPPDWSSGEVITGQMLWPGAAVDAEGNPTDWPGWNQLPDGTWFLDPSDPFYVLRSTSIVEFRINPTVATAVSYPPATAACLAGPPGTFTSTDPRFLAMTGVGAGFSSGALQLAAILALAGAVLLRRRRSA